VVIYFDHPPPHIDFAPILDFFLKKLLIFEEKTAKNDEKISQSEQVGEWEVHNTQLVQFCTVSGTKILNFQKIKFFVTIFQLW